MSYHQRNLYVLCLSIFLASVSWFQVMPFLPLFLQEMGVEKGSLLRWSGIVFSSQSLASIIMVPFWGKLGDRYGRKPMTLRAGLCLAGIYFGMSVCRSPLQLAFLRFLNGALTGFIPGAIAIIATGTPRETAPRAVATAQTASAVGQIIGPGIGGILAAAFGYRGSMHLSGFAVLFSVLLVWLLVEERGRAEPEGKTSLFQDFGFAVRSPVLTSIMLVMLVNGLFMASVNPLLAIHLNNLSARNAPEWLTGVIFSLPAAAFVVSAHRWSRFGERAGYDRAIRNGMAGAAVCALALAGLHSVWTFAAGFFALGVCIAAVSPSTGAVICTRIESSFHGRAYGMQSSAVMVGGLIAPVTATQIAAHWGVPAVFAVASVLYLGGMLAFGSISRGW